MLTGKYFTIHHIKFSQCSPVDTSSIFKWNFKRTVQVCVPEKNIYFVDDAIFDF